MWSTGTLNGGDSGKLKSQKYVFQTQISGKIDHFQSYYGYEGLKVEKTNQENVKTR